MLLDLLSRCSQLLGQLSLTGWLKQVPMVVEVQGEEVVTMTRSGKEMRGEEEETVKNVRARCVVDQPTKDVCLLSLIIEIVVCIIFVIFV